jgi:hypothetical protein
MIAPSRGCADAALSDERLVLVGLGLDRDRLVADALDLVDSVSFGERLAGGKVVAYAVPSGGRHSTSLK